MREIMLSNTGQMTQVDDCDFMFLIGITPFWYLNSWGYVSGYYEEKATCMHKIIAKRMGLNILKITDHKDINTLNNQRNNLREATQNESARNKKVRKNSKTRLKNIYFHKINKRYIVEVNRIYLGSFNTIEEAIKARNKALIEYHGEFANLED